MPTFERIEVRDASGNELKEYMVTNGMPISTFGKPPEETASIIENIANLPIRDDDLMLWSAPKSGTHWVYEIIWMLISGKIESTAPLKIDETFLEYRSQSYVEACPSPRILDSHLPFSLLPRQLKDKKTKTIALVRNPKDVCASLYNQDRGIKWLDYNGKFQDYLQLFMAGQLSYGPWFNLILEMEKAMDSGEYKMHLMFYEDLKKNTLEEIKKLAKFLEVSVSDEFCNSVRTKCSFDNMVKDKGSDEEIYFKPGFSMYRKGQIGDWKNYFTVAMSEEFDKWFEDGMKNSKLKFHF